MGVQSLVPEYTGRIMALAAVDTMDQLRLLLHYHCARLHLQSQGSSTLHLLSFSFDLLVTGRTPRLTNRAICAPVAGPLPTEALPHLAFLLATTSQSPFHTDLLARATELLGWWYARAGVGSLATLTMQRYVSPMMTGEQSLIDRGMLLLLLL